MIFRFCFTCLCLVTIGFASFFPVKDLTESGNRELSEKNYQKAIEFFKKAYERDGENHIVAYNLANVYHLLGQYNMAKSFYQKAIELSIDQKNREILSDIYYNLGTTYYKMEDYGKAIEFYKLAMDEDEDDLQIKKNYEIAFQKLRENQGREPIIPQSSQNPNVNNDENNQENQSNSEKNSGSHSDKDIANSSSTDPNQQEKIDSEKSQNSSQISGNNPISSQSEQVSSDPSDDISLKRAEQILNAYQNRQKRFKVFRKYKQDISSQPNIKNW